MDDDDFEWGEDATTFREGEFDRFSMRWIGGPIMPVSPTWYFTDLLPVDDLTRQVVSELQRVVGMRVGVMNSWDHEDRLFWWYWPGDTGGRPSGILQGTIDGLSGLADTLASVPDASVRDVRQLFDALVHEGLPRDAPFSVDGPKLICIRDIGDGKTTIKFFRDKGGRWWVHSRFWPFDPADDLSAWRDGTAAVIPGPSVTEAVPVKYAIGLTGSWYSEPFLNFVDTYRAAVYDKYCADSRAEDGDVGDGPGSFTGDREDDPEAWEEWVVATIMAEREAAKRYVAKREQWEIDARRQGLLP